MKRMRQTSRASLALVAAVAAASLAGAAWATTQAAPVNTASPTITGTTTVGQTLTAQNGTWDNNPTALPVPLAAVRPDRRGLRPDRRCDGEDVHARHCGRRPHDARPGDRGQRRRCDQRPLGPDRARPVEHGRRAAQHLPASVTGDTTVGQELTADPGPWTNNPTSYAYQWRRCDTNPFQCFDVSGATGKTYGVREADLGFRMDVVVTASNAKGSGTARSLLTAVVEPKARVVNDRPSMKIVSVRFAGPRVYARFRVCDDSLKNLTIIQTDTRPGLLSYTRRFSTLIAPKPCGVYTRNSMPAPRFRGSGKYTLVLRARDKSGLTSSMARSTFVR
jgi:hypothetical protein